MESERADLAKLQAFAKEVKQRGFTDVALLGMGGSSLGPGSAGRDLRKSARLAAFPHAGQHRSGADQGARESDEYRQDAVHRLYRNPAVRWSRTFSWRTSSTVSVRRCERTGPGETFRGRHRSRLHRSEKRAMSSASPTSSTACPRSAAATRCCPSSAWCRRRRWAST